MTFNAITLTILAVLLLMSAFFSSSETAIFSLDSINLKKMRKQKGFKRIHTMLQRSSLLLITILLGNTAVNIGLSSIMERNLHVGNTLTSTIIVTAMLLFIGEITPKTIAVRHAESVSLFNSRFLYPYYMLFRPLAIPIEALSNGILKIINYFLSKTQKEKPEDHLDALLSLVSRGSFLDSDEKRLVESVLKFTSREVYNIMTPRTKLISVDKSMSLKKLISLIKKSKYSKIPVYDQMDDNIVGVVYLRDIYPYIYNISESENKTVSDIMESMYFVPETKKLTEMLEDFQMKKIRMATIVDEYGSSLGIVTVADVLGEIVGEFIDEKFDIQKKIIRLSPQRFLVAGDTSIDDFNDYFKTEVTSEEFETLAGLVIENAGDIPEIGYTMEVEKWKLTVRNRTANQIDKFSVEKK